MLRVHGNPKLSEAATSKWRRGRVDVLFASAAAAAPPAAADAGAEKPMRREVRNCIVATAGS